VAQKSPDSGEDLLRKGRFQDAIERFRSQLSVDPENAELRARCGEAYRLSGNAERAFHHYNKGAAICQRVGDAQGALKLLMVANTLSPNEPDILFRIAECKKVLNDLRDLEPILRQLIGVAKGSGDRRRLWALEELVVRHPEDLDLACKRAEALTEAGRVDEAVTAWKGISARLDQRGIDLVPMLQRAASVAPDRAEIGIDLAAILLVNRRPRDALMLLVPYYEKFPDDIGVLEMLLKALEAIGAVDKIIPARIELVKARAKRHQKDAAMRDIAQLLQAAPDDIAALEVSAHACSSFGETAQAIALWRRLAFGYDKMGRRFERDRAVLMLLKANPDDEDALTLGARALREAGRSSEAEVLEKRLGDLRAVRARMLIPQRGSQPDESIEAIHSVRPSKPPSSPGVHIDHRVSTAPPRPKPPTLPPVPAPKLEAYAKDEDAVDYPSEDPTIPPESPESEAFALLAPTEQSEPSVESMPIAKNPWTEGLVLENAAVRFPSVKSSKRPLPPPPPPPPREDEVSDPSAPPGPSSDEARFKDDVWGSGSFAETSDFDEIGLPIEVPEDADETTSRMAQLVSDELSYRQLDDPTRAATNRTNPRSMPPEDFRESASSVRPTLRQRLVADLYNEATKNKSRS
jgi:tetratricopeptide (TPR) repeat protein